MQTAEAQLIYKVNQKVGEAYQNSSSHYASLTIYRGSKVAYTSA